MLTAISNLSAIATLILFVLYFAGKIMRIMRIKSTLCEEYKLEDTIDEDEKMLPYFVVVGSGHGTYFSVSSPTGFEKVVFYESDLTTDGDTRRGRETITFKDVLPNEKVYAKVDIPDVTEACFVEIEKNDFVQISFGIADRGYDGLLEKTNYKMKMTFKTWIYYLCS